MNPIQILLEAPCSRRSLLFAAALAAALPAAARRRRAPADRVLRNGAVYTADAARPDRARRSRSDRGQIVYVGSDRGRAPLRRQAHEVVTDLRGRMVMPGLHDGHIHGITEAADACSLDYEPLTVAEFTARIAGVPRRDAPTEEPDGWLQVSSWYQQFVLPSGTVVTKEVLDGLRTQRPIVVGVERRAHVARQLARAGARRASRPRRRTRPTGGSSTARTGSRTACCRTARSDLVSALLPPPAGDPVDEARRGMARFAREGITSFYVPGFVGADGIARVRAAAPARRA